MTVSQSNPLLISIILPVYNTAVYLPKCLQSLCKQTLQELEIICVDDGSTDNSWAVLEQFAVQDQRIRLFRQANAGCGTARNLALSKARGRYIMFCDSDDWYEPAMCQYMYQTIEKEKVDLVCCNCVIEYEKDAFGRDKNALAYHYLKFNNRLLLSSDKKSCINYTLWNKIFKKELIDTYHITFPAIKEHDDDSFVTQYLYVAKEAYGLQEKLYHYRLRKNSIMAVWHQHPNQANKWDHFLSWRHTGKFLVENLHSHSLPQEYIEQFYEIFSSVQKHFSWRVLSHSEQKKLSAMLAGLPLFAVGKLEKNLFQCRCGDCFALINQCTEIVNGCSFLWKYKRNWRENRLFVLGIEIYKQDNLKGGGRILGFFKWSV